MTLVPDQHIPDANLPVVVERKAVSVLPTSPRLDLSTVKDVRRELASVYRSVKDGKLDEQKGSKMAFILVQIGQMIKTNEIEERIEALERATNSRRLR